MMSKLGFDTFYVQGGDFGAVILQHMAILYPDTVLGFHSNMCTVYTPKSFLRALLSTVFPSWYVKPEHYDRVFPLKEKFFEKLRESGYLHIQATKPDTIATTSFRLYAETFNRAHYSLGITRHPVQVPSACARFSNDFYAADGFLDELYPNLVQLTDYEGGHFAAFQTPDVLANDLFDALEKFEKFNIKNRPDIVKKSEERHFYRDE
ncbi:hypothetical protein NQ314_011432 [Rhamnusium bicolor]|uniref:Epoxide hydrolase n=1 Tax=Rhamnusium bicolor TaxID=1586634 RepID=A0AAV8XJI8_9CUCU|nr:hypothetical protein NQ314_011432 [Rhamnusium bicolor]